MIRTIPTHQEKYRSMLGSGALCIALLLSGCGGGSGGNASTPVIPPTPTSPGDGNPTPAVCAASQCAPAP